MMTNNQTGAQPVSLSPLSASPAGQTGMTMQQRPTGLQTQTHTQLQPQLQPQQLPSSTQLTYEQFQEQVRRKQEQEEQMARMALLQAGADSRSEKVRSLATMLQSVREEVKLAENQLQQQMDAQRRQFGQIALRIAQMEAQIAEVIRPQPGMLQ